jgi:hypothetical protein
MMIGLLAVPVGVLLLVVVLALIGSRWTVPGSDGEPEPLEDYDEPFVDPWSADPWRLAEPPRPALPPASRPMLPPPRPALPPASRLALPAAPPAPPPPGSHAPSQDLVPAPRPYHRTPSPPPARPAYGVLSHERYDRPPEPDPESSQQQGFPYGPYRHQ